MICLNSGRPRARCPQAPTAPAAAARTTAGSGPESQVASLRVRVEVFRGEQLEEEALDAAAHELVDLLRGAVGELVAVDPLHGQHLARGVRVVECGHDDIGYEHLHLHETHKAARVGGLILASGVACR